MRFFKKAKDEEMFCEKCVEAWKNFNVDALQLTEDNIDKFPAFVGKENLFELIRSHPPFAVICFNQSRVNLFDRDFLIKHEDGKFSYMNEHEFSLMYEPELD